MFIVYAKTFPPERWSIFPMQHGGLASFDWLQPNLCILMVHSGWNCE